MVVMDGWALIIALCGALLVGYFGYSVMFDLAI
jgi:hypothetical protein